MQIQHKESKRIPGPGDTSDLFERLSCYITLIDNDWFNRIEPASGESINLLKKLSNIDKIDRDLPKAYSIFLNYMGEHDGGILEKTLLGDASISSIIDYYEQTHKYEPETINPECLVFFSPHMTDSISIDLRHSKNEVIMYSSEGEFDYFCAENFEKLLFQCAFIRYERLFFSEMLSFGGSTNMMKAALNKHQTSDILKVVDIFAKENNFQKCWFSDKSHYFGIRDNVTFFVNIDYNGAAVMGMFADEYEVINDLGNRLVELDIGVKLKNLTPQ